MASSLHLQEKTGTRREVSLPCSKEHQGAVARSTGVYSWHHVLSGFNNPVSRVLPSSFTERQAWTGFKSSTTWF